MNPAVTAPVASLPREPDPVLVALERIERRLAEVERVTSSLAPVADLIAAVPGGIATLTDTVDTLAARLGDRGVDLDDRLRSVVRAVEVSTTPRAVHALAALVESQLLEPSALAVVSRLAAALAEPGAAEPVGMWGAMRALRDPDVQRALGFVLAVGRTFGRHLGTGELEACRDRLINAPAIAGALEAP
jgi:uncharacterized protein DUF1641